MYVATTATTTDHEGNRPRKGAAPRLAGWRNRGVPDCVGGADRAAVRAPVTRAAMTLDARHHARARGLDLAKREWCDEITCQCGAAFFINPRPTHPDVTARRIVLFVDEHANRCATIGR